MILKRPQFCKFHFRYIFFIRSQIQGYSRPQCQINKVFKSSIKDNENYFWYASKRIYSLFFLGDTPKLAQVHHIIKISLFFFNPICTILEESQENVFPQISIGVDCSLWILYIYLYWLAPIFNLIVKIDQVLTLILRTLEDICFISKQSSFCWLCFYVCSTLNSF